MSLSLIILAVFMFIFLIVLISAILELNRETKVLGVEMINDLDNVNKTLEIMFNNKRI